ncbi:hypothetical protein [Streptomyces triticirhizae]|nr:hypothetical protein [Streptomyces triticirhizae]
MTRVRKFALGLALVTTLWVAGAGVAQADRYTSGIPADGTLSSGR